jgi:sugar/nucleoside kinase (ribokinase family)
LNTVTVTLFSRIGDDVAGEFYRQDLAKEGADLDLSEVQVVPGASTSVSSILVDANGERLVVPHNDLKLDTTNSLCAVHDAIDRHLKTGEVVSCLTDVRWPDGAAVLLQASAAHGLLAMLDADVAPSGVLRRLAPLATHVAFSEDGLRIFVDEPPGQDTDQERNGDEICAAKLTRQRLLQALARLPDAKLVGVTLGARGFLWWERPQADMTLADMTVDTMGGGALKPTETVTLWQIVAPAVKVVDTLGAGDVFHAALTVALSCCENMALPQAGTVRSGHTRAAERQHEEGGGARLQPENSPRRVAPASPAPAPAPLAAPPPAVPAVPAAVPAAAAAVRFACAAAALKCARAGGRLGAPHLAEVEHALLDYAPTSMPTKGLVQFEERLSVSHKSHRLR